MTKKARGAKVEDNGAPKIKKVDPIMVDFQVEQTRRHAKKEVTNSIGFSFSTTHKLDWEMLVKNTYQRVINCMDVRTATGCALFSPVLPFTVTCKVNGLKIDTSALCARLNMRGITYSAKNPLKFKNTFSAIVRYGEILSDMKDYSK